MLHFAFWNLRRNPALAPLVAELARSRTVDVLALAECVLPDEELLTALNAYSTEATLYARVHTFLPAGPVHVFVRGDVLRWETVAEHRHWTAWEAVPNRANSFLLFAAHLISKREFTEQSQADEAQVFAEAIREVEGLRGHTRTVVVGDLNMNPFERGVVSARGLHAVPSRALAAEVSRVVQDREYPYFYNPMWGRLGDQEGTPGTYFLRRAEHVCHFWNLFDQVLLRPEMVPLWRSESLEIVDQIRTRSLLHNGVPDQKRLSDHLPLTFALDI